MDSCCVELFCRIKCSVSVSQCGCVYRHREFVTNRLAVVLNPLSCLHRQHLGCSDAAQQLLVCYSVESLSSALRV